MNAPVKSLTICLLLVSALARGATPYRELLVSDSPPKKIDSWRIRSSDVTPRSQKKWSVTQEVLHGGKQEGVDLITVDNGAMKLRILPTRGMGIWDVVSGDVRLGWNSPVKEAVHPRHINLSSRGGMGWLEGFNEWFVRCGLESAGFPGEDLRTNAAGKELKTDLTLHGKIANIPASRVEVAVDRDPPYTIHILGRVEERMFYGPKLVLETDLAIVPGSREFSVTDRITNAGDYEQEFQLIYHINFGDPLLGKGSRFTAPVKSIFPFNEHTAAGLKTFDLYDAPTPGFEEHIYCLTNHADQAGNSVALLKNPSGSRGAALRYSTAQLPCFTLWKNTAPLKEGYVTGFEPATGYPYNRMIERKHGRVPVLQPGQTRTIALHFQILSTPAEVSEIENRIRTISGGQPPQVINEPPQE